MPSAALRRWPLLLLAIVIAGFAVVSLREAWLDSPTLDEPVYVSGGVLTLLHHDLRFNHEHPPLPRALAALPVLAAQPAVPPNGHFSEWHYASVFVTAQLHAGKLRLVTYLSRLVPILEAIALALVLYRIGAMLLGPPAGAVAAVLWLAEPVTIGVGHLDGVDIPLALAAACSALALLSWLRRRGRGSLVLLGIACGAAAAAGVPGLLVTVLAAGVVVAASWRERGWRAAGRGAAVILTAVAFLWASYAVFNLSVLLHPVYLLPRPFVAGLRFLAANDSAGQTSYLLGMHWNGHQWWYWPGTLLVKIPLPALFILAAGPFGWCWAPPQARREALLVVALPAATLAAPVVSAYPDTGVRYLLPAFACWTVAASAVVLIARRAAARAAVAALTAATVVIAASSFPHSIAWTAPPFRPGYQAAADSNLDWGQDYTMLDQWSLGRDPYVWYYGNGALRETLAFRARPLYGTDIPQITGWVAVSATTLARSPWLSWLRAYCSVGTLGGSIVLYRFSQPPSAAPGPDRPAGLCPGRASYRVFPLARASLAPSGGFGLR